jgi:hypothetical protein
MILEEKTNLFLRVFKIGGNEFKRPEPAKEAL